MMKLKASLFLIFLSLIVFTANSKATKIFDLASGKNDFAEIQEAFGDGTAIGSTVKFNFSNGFKSSYCISYGTTKSGKPSLYCGIEPGNSNILIYSKNKEVRLELLKKREPNQKKFSTGRIIEKMSDDMPVIEID